MTNTTIGKIEIFLDIRVDGVPFIYTYDVIGTSVANGAEMLAEADRAARGAISGQIAIIQSDIGDAAMWAEKKAAALRAAEKKGRK